MQFNYKVLTVAFYLFLKAINANASTAEDWQGISVYADRNQITFEDIQAFRSGVTYSINFNTNIMKDTIPQTVITALNTLAREEKTQIYYVVIGAVATGKTAPVIRDLSNLTAPCKIAVDIDGVILSTPAEKKDEENYYREHLKPWVAAMMSNPIEVQLFSHSELQHKFWLSRTDLH